MLSHGIVSSGLFLLVGMIYDRYKTRVLFYYGGLSQVMPMCAFVFFVFILGNISFPLTVLLLRSF
jgi:NADH-quinone oxidoreductase subunit M